MEINQEVLDREIRIHKLSISNYIKNEKDKTLVNYFSKTGKEICLILSNFKCEKCKIEEDLQFHHIITNKYKYYMPLKTYHTQRNYYANILILCRECHIELHKNENIRTPLLTISQRKIETIKKKYKKLP